MKKNKLIWFVNFHTAPPHLTGQPRYLGMIPYLKEAGYDIVIVGQSYLRNYKIDLIKDNRIFIEQDYDGFKYIHIKSLKHSGNTLRRMLAYFVFSLRLFSIANKVQKPDIIIHNIHIPFDLPVYFLSRRLKASYIAEVWDLWPEFFHRMGLVKKSNPFVTLSYKMEAWLYKKADKIVYTMEGWPDYIKNKKWDVTNGGKINIQKAVHITNGLDINTFLENKEKDKIIDADLNNDGFFKVVYLGSIRKANNLKPLIDAAAILKDQEMLKFLIFGDGEERDRLEEYVKNNKITNVIFKQKHIRFNQIPFVLSKSSLNILNYQQGFGDFGVSSGKLPLYLASGKPILTNVSVAYCIIKKNNLGISEKIQSPEHYAKRIVDIMNLDKKEYDAMCNRVLENSKEFDYEVLTSGLINILNDIDQ